MDRRHRIALVTAALVASLLPAWNASSQTPAPPDPSLARLQASIERVTANVNATWGVYVKCLETGEEIAIGADRQMDTMSVIKIPLMVEVFEQIKAGRFRLEDRYTLVKEDMIGGTGVIRSFDPGAVLTVKDLVTLMIVVSDNTATDVLYRMVGGVEPVNRRMEGMGLKATRAPGPARAWFDAIAASPNRDEFHRAAKSPFGLSTPREIGRLLEMMELGTLVDKPSSELMLRIMRGQIYRTRIPRYLSGWSIPHKTGDFLPYIGNDVGVLESKTRRVVLSVFTANHFGSGERLEEAIGRIAEQVGAYFGYRQ